MWWEILERYTQPGQVVLDPMSGIGSTLMACLMGRSVVCVEMETHFLEPMAASWAKMQRVGPMLGHQMGQAVIVRGDARMLPLQSADAIVTSPPFEDCLYGKEDFSKYAKGGDTYHGQGYTRPVSAVVTSPPFGGAEMHTGGDTPTVHGIGRKTREQRPVEAKGKNLMLHGQGYTQVDAVVTSPPYEESLSGGGKSIDWSKAKTKRGAQGPNGQGKGALYEYSEDFTNIGNLRGPRYWEAMEAVYRECHRVLIPGGVMALVLKGYSRAGRYIDLPGQSAECIEGLGFEVFDRWTREVPLSFWRTLQKQNGNWDEALRYEHVIAARKL